MRANGYEALAWCKRQAADMLVTDIPLPGEVDGSPNAVASMIPDGR
jgi:hypothetical protein